MVYVGDNGHIINLHAFAVIFALILREILPLGKLCLKSRAWCWFLLTDIGSFRMTLRILIFTL